MSTLHVILDQLLSRVPGGIGQYTEALTRELIALARPGWDVSGIISATPNRRIQSIKETLPGLSSIRRSPLNRIMLARAWQSGLALGRGRGPIHAPSLLAPLGARKRQVAVTIHDVVPWSHPETLTARGVEWHKAMARRAQRFADMIVVPSNAVAVQLEEMLPMGDRIRVIGGAVRATLTLPDNPELRAAKLGLPERYILAVGTHEPRKGLDRLVRAMAHPAAPTLPLLVAGPVGWGNVDVDDLSARAGLSPGRILDVGRLSETDLAVAYDRATVCVLASYAEGFGLPILEAFRFGTPVVHFDVPALTEVSGGASLIVQGHRDGDDIEQLALALAQVVEDQELAARLVRLGKDRETEFTWRGAAEKVWQLHADL